MLRVTNIVIRSRIKSISSWKGFYAVKILTLLSIGILRAFSNDFFYSIGRAFFRSRSCTQSVFDRYCNGTVPVPAENRFNPFCTDPGNETIIAFQASTKPKNDTNILSKPRQPTASGARRNMRVLSRMLSMAVGIVNLTNVVRSLVLN